MGNRCTIDISQGYILDPCTDEAGSLQPKEAAVWEAIIVDIFPRIWRESFDAVSIYFGWGEFENETVDYAAKPTIPLGGKPCQNKKKRRR